MKFLIDNNIFIPVEPTAPRHLEPGSPVIAELLGLFEQGGHQVYLHPAAQREVLENDRDEGRRALRRILVKKYALLPSPPAVSMALKGVIGDAVGDTNDAVDHLLLAAVDRDAVDYLVTDDVRLLGKAERAGLGRRVLSTADALATVRGLFAKTPAPPPAVEQLLAHELDETDPIFDSFRADYVGFDEWLSRAKRTHRTSWIIRSRGLALAGVSIVKTETDAPYDLRGRVLKICSFKIADAVRGYRYGELLLKTVFGYAFTNSYEHIYVTVFEKYRDLIELFEAFGFRRLPRMTHRGEAVLAKPLVFNEAEYAATSPLEFNVRYGPPHIHLHGAPFFIVPIKPHYHRLLFPDAEPQMNFVAGQDPFGNSIRKAYLCHANTRQITPGSVLLFYRSEDEQLVRCVGVAEETLVSQDARNVARFVGQRTVYRYDEIEQMCAKPVLAILFRHARIMKEPVSIQEMHVSAAIKAAPQSIVRVRQEAMEWARCRLGQSP
jgi:L-amino acid N-acyltransferase YncA